MAVIAPRKSNRIIETISFILIGIAVIISVAILHDPTLAQGVILPILTLSIACAMWLVLRREGAWQLHLNEQTELLQRKVEEAEAKNRWLKLTEASAHVGHWRLDLKTNDVFWSDETARIHGLEPGTAPDLDAAIDMYHPEDRLIVNAAVETARSTGEPFEFRARLMRADGDIRHAESIARLEFDCHGKPAALFGILADRTDEEAMRAELREARDEARALADAKSSFLAKVSHEIRTPMNGVLGFADLLLASKLSETQRHHASLIAESGHNLQTLLNDILDLSKIEAGEMQVHARQTQLAELIESVTQLGEPLAHERNLTLVHSVDSALPDYVMLDPVRLRQIITNLLANALRFTDRGEISVRATAQDARLCIAIRDTGIGISSEMSEEIFQAFTMADASNVHGRGGTGLGLPICRQLAELMGGSLSMESTPGEGSCFTISLPLVRANVQLGEAKRHSAERPAVGLWADVPILLAEDFDINRELVAAMGKQLQLEIHEACDGAEAVAKVREASRKGRPFGLVLMDLQMPVMDGIAATRMIREAGYDPASLPILALTANAFADDIEQCRNAGMQAHLAKPLSLEAFRNALTRWLPADNARAA